MAILQIKAARHWSLEQTAHAFLVTVGTVKKSQAAMSGT